MGLNDWAISLASTLENSYKQHHESINQESIHKKIEFVQKAISEYLKKPSKYSNYQSLDNTSKKIHNLWKWYKNNRENYSSPKLRINDNIQELMDRFKMDDFYILKNCVEIIWKKLVLKHLKDKLVWKDWNIDVYLTSDFDDVTWWVDLIVSVNNEYYLWIDIAVSDNKDYLSLKKEKWTSVCREFNLYKWLPVNTQIVRVVLDFERIIMADLLIEFFNHIEYWETIDILDLYEKIYKKRHNSKNNYMSLESAITDRTKKDTERILTLN
jgi:hypothetical protein